MSESTTINPFLRGLAEKEIRRTQSWRRSALWLFVLGMGGLVVSVLIGEVGPYFSWGMDFIKAFVAAKHLPIWLPEIVLYLVPPCLLLGLMMGLPLFLVWWERKVAGHTQMRLGPMDVGGWHGWAQVMADGIKLFLKEIIEPDGVDRWVFRLAPLVVFLPAYLSFAPLPFGHGLVVLDFDIGLFFVLAISGLSTVGILMAGWGSASSWRP